MIKRSEWVKEVDDLLQGTKYDRFSKSHAVNVAAAGFILGVTPRQARALLNNAGYYGGRIGKCLLFDKSSLYDAMKFAKLFS